MRRSLLFGILALAFALRFIGISNHPTGFTPDEASFGYDAYSLLKTGKDQWGETWPLTLRSFGDFKLPLYTYLTIPSVALFGLNEFAVRLPNVLLGGLAVIGTFLATDALFRNKKIALASSLLLCISPWHISLSRGAFEANLTTFFMPFGIYMFVRGLKDGRWMIASSLFFGINLFTYHSARMITPVIVGSLILVYRKYLKLKPRGVPVAIFVFFLLLAAFTMFSGAGRRGGDIAIFNPTDNWQAVSDRRYTAVLEGLPDPLSRVFANKIFYTTDQFISSYANLLSPQFLFTQGAGEWTYGMIPGRGVLYLFEVIFVLCALFYAIKNKDIPLRFLLLWILLSPIPASLTKGPGFAANRASVMMPALQILSGFGAVLVLEWLKKKKFAQRVPVLLGTGVIFLAFFLQEYIYLAPPGAAPSMLYGRREMISEVAQYEKDYNQILISRSLSEPQMYTAFYKKWDPTDYQNEAQSWLEYEDRNMSFVDQLGNYSLGKYTFSDINYQENSKIPSVLFAGKPSEFPSNINPIKRIISPGGKDLIWIVSSIKQ